MPKKLVFLPCLPWDYAALEDWANGLAREGLAPVRIPSLLPFLAVVGDGPAGAYTVEPARGGGRDGCAVPWVGTRISPGRPSGKYHRGGARRRALNINYILTLFSYFALVLTLIGISDGLGFLNGEAKFSTLGSALFIVNVAAVLVLIGSAIFFLVLTIRVKYNRACLTSFSLATVSAWLWAISRAAIWIITLI